jgi:hypothetical protein
LLIFETAPFFCKHPVYIGQASFLPLFLSLGVKWSGYEADNLSPTSSEINNGVSYMSTPPHVLYAWCLIWYKDNIMFTFPFSHLFNLYFDFTLFSFSVFFSYVLFSFSPPLVEWIIRILICIHVSNVHHHNRNILFKSK